MISLKDKRQRLTVYHEMMNIGASEEQITKLVNQSMDHWIKANPDLLNECIIDLSDMEEEDLNNIMWELANIEEFEKAAEIKNFLNNKL